MKTNLDGIDKHKFPQVVNQQVSADGARKYVLELEDGPWSRRWESHMAT